MALAFILLALVVVVSAFAAMTLRRLVHCALCLVATFAGLAGLYLQLNAQFVGFAQILVYIGAVATLILFAVLLTRGDDSGADRERVASPSWFVGAGVALLVFGALATCVLTTTVIPASKATAKPTVLVRTIGERLMTDYVLPLEVVGLLLTAAMIGAVIIAKPVSDEAETTRLETESKPDASPAREVDAVPH